MCNIGLLKYYVFYWFFVGIISYGLEYVVVIDYLELYYELYYSCILVVLIKFSLFLNIFIVGWLKERFSFLNIYDL